MNKSENMNVRCIAPREMTRFCTPAFMVARNEGEAAGYINFNPKPGLGLFPVP